MPAFDWRDGAAGFLTIEGKRLETLCHGPAPDAAPTIVTLHEGLGCVALWRDFPRRLSAATGLGVFAYSRAGYGQSDPAPLPRPLDYMTREARETLPAVLRSDRLPARDSARAQRRRLDRGDLCGHGRGFSRARSHTDRAALFHRGKRPRRHREPRAKPTRGGDLRAKLAKYHRDVDNAFRGWNDAWLDPGFKSWNIAETIDYWRIPVLAIQGENDAYGTIAQIREIENRIYSPVDVEILKGCRHSPHTERPEKTLAAVADFCARLMRIEQTKVEIKWAEGGSKSAEADDCAL